MHRGQSEDSTSRARIAVVDDLPVSRQGYATWIESQPDLGVCTSVGTASEALGLVRNEPPDLLILGLSNERLGGLELIKRLKAVAPRLKMLVTSSYEEELIAGRALRAGAQGYIPKEASLEELLEAVRQVLEGRIYLSPRMTDQLLHSAATGAEDLGREPVHQLSDRELEVFALIGEGQTTREIAHRLGLSIKTVETHREHIKRKLGLRSGNQLIRRAVEWVIQGPRSRT